MWTHLEVWLIGVLSALIWWWWFPCFVTGAFFIFDRAGFLLFLHIKHDKIVFVCTFHSIIGKYQFFSFILDDLLRPLAPPAAYPEKAADRVLLLEKRWVRGEHQTTSPPSSWAPAGLHVEPLQSGRLSLCPSADADPLNENKVTQWCSKVLCLFHVNVCFDILHAESTYIAFWLLIRNCEDLNSCPKTHLE